MADEGKRYEKGEVSFSGCRDGLDNADPRGAYVSLTVALDEGGEPVRVKMNRLQAATLARDILENT